MDLPVSLAYYLCSVDKKGKFNVNDGALGRGLAIGSFAELTQIGAVSIRGKFVDVTGHLPEDALWLKTIYEAACDPLNDSDLGKIVGRLFTPIFTSFHALSNASGYSEELERRGLFTLVPGFLNFNHYKVSEEALNSIKNEITASFESGQIDDANLLLLIVLLQYNNNLKRFAPPMGRKEMKERIDALEQSLSEEEQAKMKTNKSVIKGVIFASSFIGSGTF